MIWEINIIIDYRMYFNWFKDDSSCTQQFFKKKISPKKIISIYKNDTGNVTKSYRNYLEIILYLKTEINKKRYSNIVTNIKILMRL